VNEVFKPFKNFFLSTLTPLSTLLTRVDAYSDLRVDTS
jgi:hypothetical protein